MVFLLFLLMFYKFLHNLIKICWLNNLFFIKSKSLNFYIYKTLNFIKTIDLNLKELLSHNLLNIN
jgi:hypothetical protein